MRGARRDRGAARSPSLTTLGVRFQLEHLLPIGVGESITRDGEPAHRPGPAADLCGAAATTAQERVVGVGRLTARRRRARVLCRAGLTALPGVPVYLAIPTAAGVKFGKTDVGAGEPAALGEDLAQDRAVVGRHRQVAVRERAGCQRRPLPEHLAAVDRRRRARAPPDRARGRPRRCRSPYARRPNSESVTSVTFDSAGPRSVAKAARHAATSASWRCSQPLVSPGCADAGVHVPVVVVQAGDLQADVALDEPGQVLQRLAEIASSDT